MKLYSYTCTVIPVPSFNSTLLLPTNYILKYYQSMKACLFSCEFANAVRRSCDHMLFLPYSIVHGIFLSLNLLLNQTFFFPPPPFIPLIV